MDKFKICYMSLSSLEEISPNLETDFDDFWNYNILKSELMNPNSKYIVAKFNNSIVGFGGIWKSIDEIHITNIVVRKDFRQLGIGTLILESLINMSKTFNVSCITLEVNALNTAAIKLYKKYNFKEAGIRKKYYNNKDNAIIMTLYF